MLSSVFLPLALLASLAQSGERPPPSEGVYRLPYADGVRARVFDDTASHRPRGRVDLVGLQLDPVEIVAAADGKVVAIEDGHAEQQSGRVASECRNNYVWIEHANGEWTLYSHMTYGSTTGAAGLKLGDRVQRGQLLGHEGAVGCAMLAHLHFEVARPSESAPLDAGGFLTDNADGRRLREPRFCGLEGPLTRDRVYTAGPCRED